MHLLYFWARVARRFLFSPLASVQALTTIVRIASTINKNGPHVVFFDRLAIHFTFCSAVAQECVQLGCTPVYIVSDSGHPLLTSSDPDYRAFYIPPGFELFIRFIQIPYLITAASNIEIHCKNKKTRIGHMFHSPVSLHYVYQDSAFDAYDFFFCVGPHHSVEIAHLATRRGWTDISTYELGYPKIDALVNAAKLMGQRDDDCEIRSVLFAPSWGGKNVLRSHGYEIVKVLLDEGFEVVLRPHKHSFDYDMDVLDQIQNSFGERRFRMDDSLGFDSMLESDLLISDWSGIAYEFAFSTGRPVIFVDVEGGRKIQSDENRCIPLESMEDVCRYEVGLVCGPHEIVSNVVEAAKMGKNAWRSRIRSVQDKYFYNFGDAAGPIADQIVKLTGCV